MLIYILVIIFFSSSNTKIQERKEKIKRPSHPPPPPPHSRISIDPCTSKIRNIYLQKTKTKQTNRKELGGGWAGDLRVKRKESRPQGGGGNWASQIQASLSLLCLPWGGYHTGNGESSEWVPFAMLPWEGLCSESVTQAANGFIFCGFHH